jgi:biopolymer transport protein ExbD
MAVEIRKERQSHRFHSMELTSSHGGGGRSGDVIINVTALVDMMMVLVIFLVMNFNASGEMNFVSKDLKMPQAEHGLDLTRVPIVALDSKNNLYFEGAVIADLGAIDPDDPDLKIAELEERLVQEREKFERIDASRAADLPPEEDPTSTVNVQADKATKMSVLKRVLHTCEVAGYGRIRLAVGDGRQADEVAGHGGAPAAEE